PCRAILSRDPALLADAAGRRANAELFRNPAEDRAAGRRYPGFSDSGPSRSRRRRTDQSVRNRIARTDVVARDRRSYRRAGGTVKKATCGGRAHRRPSGRVEIFDTLLDGLVLDWLVESFTDGMLQPLDLILDHQFAALQLD